jgi:ATP-dependent Lon protease
MANQPKAGRIFIALPPQPVAVDLYDREAIAAELNKFNSEFGDDLQSADPVEVRRFRLLGEMYRDPRGPSRKLLVGSDGVVDAVSDLRDEMMNFKGPIAVILGAIHRSKLSRSAIRLPPLLLVGEPGVGKSHFLNRVGAALGTTTRAIALSLLDDTGAITGHSASWKSARAGDVAQTLLNSFTASPLFICDELDKIPALSRDENPINIFHSLLESENAKAFEDQFLRIPLRADHALWVFTANSLANIPASILDRLLVFHIPMLDEAESQKFVMRSIERALADCGHTFEAELDSTTLQLLSKSPTRQLKRAIDVAIGIAAAAGRRRLSSTDFREAICTCSNTAAQKNRRIGFL